MGTIKPPYLQKPLLKGQQREREKDGEEEDRQRGGESRCGSHAIHRSKMKGITRAGQKARSAFPKCEIELQSKTLITFEAESANFMNSAAQGMTNKAQLQDFIVPNGKISLLQGVKQNA